MPRSGPSAVLGPSCEACARLAVEEINVHGGVHGHEVTLYTLDGGREPGAVAADVDKLVTADRVGAVVGWHGSAVLRMVAATIRGRVPYVYTAPHEGRHRGPGIFFTGETPWTQVLPALRWMAQERAVRRWYIVGNDDEWPLVCARLTHQFSVSTGVTISGDEVLPVGTVEFGPTIRRAERSGAQGVLMFLLGMDVVRFNRAFTQMLADGHCVRFAPLMEENMLLASGAANTRRLFAAARYFETLPTAAALDFGMRYHRRFGVQAPLLNAPGESCFEALTLLAFLAEQAGSLEMADLCAVADAGRIVCPGPRGEVGLHNNQLDQHVYLAEAEGADFNVIAEITTP